MCKLWMSIFQRLFFLKYFFIGIQLLYYVVLASPVQHSEKKLYVCINPLPLEPPSTLCPPPYHSSRSPQRTKPSFLCYAITNFYFNKLCILPRGWFIAPVVPGIYSPTTWGFPGGYSDKESSCQLRRHKRRKFNLWVGKMPWKSHGQRSLAGYSPWGRKESEMTECLSVHTHTHRRACTHDVYQMLAFLLKELEFLFLPSVICIALSWKSRY